MSESTFDSSNRDDLTVPLTNEFVLPTNESIGARNIQGDALDKPATYLCGNSLGPISQRSETLINEELKVWRGRAVEGHFAHPHGRKWVNICDHVTPLLAEIVGANEPEVACMGTLTANLHLMMNNFYKPTKERFKILCEAKAFPSDQYAFASQVVSHGLDPQTAIIEVSPRKGEYALREEDILKLIEDHGSSIALVLFSGVQYYTGQFFPIQSITKKAKEQGCICGWDLAHAVGNVPLQLHDWDVDFAVWCTYKYLNSGPGGIAGLYIHEKWNHQSPMFAGWWGHDLSSRFQMPPQFSRIPGAQGHQLSNPSMLDVVSLLGSLQVFKQVGMMSVLRQRSLKLTAAFEGMLLQSRFFIPLSEVVSNNKAGFTIITPTDPSFRGAQLSLLFFPSALMQSVFDYLGSYGVIGDKREPDVIRLAPAPLYNTILDCECAALRLEQALSVAIKDVEQKQTA